MSHDGSVKLLFFSTDFRIYRILCGEHFLTSVHVVGQWVSHGFSVAQSIKTLKKSFCPFNIMCGTY